MFNNKEGKSERDRLLTNRSSNADALDTGNQEYYEEIEKKTEQMKAAASMLNSQLDQDSLIVKGAYDTILNGSSMMNKGLLFVRNITNDPTGLGIMKIAFLVFTVLCVMYFGGKLVFKLYTLIGKKK